MLSPCFKAVTKAWLAVKDFTDLEHKTIRLRKSVNIQVDAMVQRFEEERAAGNINETSFQKRVLAAERWRRSKVSELMLHAQDKEEDAMTAVLEAAPHLEKLWHTVRAKEKQLASLGSGSQLPAAEPEEEANDGHYPSELQLRDDMELLTLELEDTLNLQLSIMTAEARVAKIHVDVVGSYGSNQLVLVPSRTGHETLHCP